MFNEAEFSKAPLTNKGVTGGVQSTKTEAVLNASTFPAASVARQEIVRSPPWAKVKEAVKTWKASASTA